MPLTDKIDLSMNRVSLEQTIEGSMRCHARDAAYCSLPIPYPAAGMESRKTANFTRDTWSSYETLPQIPSQCANHPGKAISDACRRRGLSIGGPGIRDRVQMRRTAPISLLTVHPWVVTVKLMTTLAAANVSISPGFRTISGMCPARPPITRGERSIDDRLAG